MVCSYKRMVLLLSIRVYFLKHPQYFQQCNRLKCPLARLSGPMRHNGHGINLYGVIMNLMAFNMQEGILTGGLSVLVHRQAAVFAEHLIS